MANLIGIVDSAYERRRKYVDSVRPHLKIFDWLQYDEMQQGDTLVAWAAAPSVPVSRSRNADGIPCFVLGDFENPHESTIPNADYASGLARDNGIEALGGRSGFYMACMWDAPKSIVLGVDILGLFPLYYYSTPEFLLFSTMHSLFRFFPPFTPEISPRGLAGILLTMHITGEQTLFKDVRRLPVGRILRWQEGEGRREIATEKLRPTSACFQMPYSENLDVFDHLLGKAISKSASSRKALLLSGGLDSRLLAGYLSRMPLLDPFTVSVGDETDNEVRFASEVANALGWRQLRIKVDYTRFPEFARKLVEIEQISNGFADLAFFQTAEDFHGIAPEIMTGFAGDIVMGGSHLRAGYDRSRHEHTFAAKFSVINRYGFTPDQIKQLVNPDILGDSVDEALEDLKNAYDSIEGQPFQRTWMFDMNHRLRFHTAASIAWRLSFGSWPKMPYIDKELLEAAFSMPEDTLTERRVQEDLLCRHFPSLAALPLERLTLDTFPLLMPFYRRILASLLRKYSFQRRKQQVLKILKIPVPEARFYFRTFDINNEGWSGVRKDAEQHRAKTERLFVQKVLRELLPAPDIPIRVPEATVDSSCRKLLLAFMLWAGENL